MKLVLLIALGSFFTVACATQDEIVTAKTPADTTTNTTATTTAAQKTTTTAPANSDWDQQAARRKAQDDADWAQAQQEYQAEKQQMN
jgi:hypothetical protein